MCSISKMEFKIYTLTDPIDHQVKYIGQTITPLVARLYSHCKVNGSMTKKKAWIISLKNKGLVPTIELLEVHDTKEASNEAEVFWIAYFRFLGFQLKNLATGGNTCAGCKWSTEAIERISLVRKGRRLNPNSRKGIPATGKRAKGHKQGPDVRPLSSYKWYRLSSAEYSNK